MSGKYYYCARNTQEENKEIKEGKVPESWKDSPHKLSQKDTDVRWINKNGKNQYGYKMHINADRKHKIIRDVEVTSASTHDSQVFESLLVKNTSKDVWADIAYYHKRNALPDGYREHIQRKGNRGKSLTLFQEYMNTKRSRIRCRVEHVFGYVKGKMRLFIRTIGRLRAETKIILSAITYNMIRSVRIA